MIRSDSQSLSSCGTQLSSRGTMASRCSSALRKASCATCCLVLFLCSRPAAAQDGVITVSEPQSGDIVYAGSPFDVTFEALGGVVSPYDVNLYRGGDQVLSWCSESEGCNITNGTISVNIPATYALGDNYKVQVSERSSSVSATSGIFELAEANTTPSPIYDGAGTEYQDVGGGGTVGRMNLAMLVIACICGLSLFGSLVVAYYLRRRRPGTKSKVVEGARGDLEHGRSAGDMGSGGLNTGDESPSSSPTPQRSFRSGSSARDPSDALVSTHPYGSSQSASKEFEMDRYRSPARTLVRGSQQRSRSVSRESGRGGGVISGAAEDQGPTMYPNLTPGRPARGPVMVATTPQRRIGTPGRMSRGAAAVGGMTRSSSRGRTVMGSASWDERRLSRSPRRQLSDTSSRDSDGRRVPRSRSRSRSIEDWRQKGIPPRTLSIPRRPRVDQESAYRRSLSVGRELARYGDPEEDWEVELQRRTMAHGVRATSLTPGRLRGIQPRVNSERRSRSMRGAVSSIDHDFLRGGRGGAGDGGGGGSSDGRADSGHSLEAGRVFSRTWSRSPSRHTPHRSGMSERRPRSSRSRHDNYTASGPSKYEQRGRSTSSRARSIGSRSSVQRGTSTSRSRSPSRHTPRRSGMALLEPGSRDVSWEEIRSNHHKSRGRTYVVGSDSVPSYVEAASISPASGSRTGSVASDNRLLAGPSFYEATAKGGSTLSIGVHAGPGDEGFRSRDEPVRILSRPGGRSRSSSAKRRGGYSSRSHSPGNQSPGSRAISARKAARDAQESAERALAAAAAASHAADLAAQAAIDAEAEAEGGFASETEDTSKPPLDDEDEHGDGALQGTPVTSYSPPPGSAPDTEEASRPSSLREKMKVFEAGRGGEGGEVGGSGGGGSTPIAGGSTSSSRGQAKLFDSSGDGARHETRLRSWRESEEHGVHMRTETSTSVVKESLVTMTRGALSSVPQSSWAASDDRDGGGADIAAGSPGGEQSAATSLAGSRSEGKSRKRRAFVRQYSGDTTCDGESDLSLHESLALVPTALPDTLGVAAATSGFLRQPYMSPGSGLNSVDGSDLSFIDAMAAATTGRAQRSHEPRSPLRNVPASAANDNGVDSVGITVKKREPSGLSQTSRPRVRAKSGSGDVADAVAVASMDNPEVSASDGVAIFA